MQGQLSEIEDLRRRARTEGTRMIDALQSFVGYASVNPPAESGEEVSAETGAALAYYLDHARSLGLRARNLDGIVGYVEAGPAEAEETVGVLVHADVVPAGEGWTHPPFAGEIADGMIWGRGVEDDKGPAISAVYALKALADGQIRMRRKVRLIVGTHEEGGRWVCVARYLRSEGAPTLGFTPDGDFPMICGEKGVMGVRVRASVASVTPYSDAVVGWWAGTAANIVPALAWAALKLDGATTALCREDYERLCQQVAAQHAQARLRVLGPEEFRALFPQLALPACDLALVAEGVESHGAMPWDGHNAMQDLAGVLSLADASAGGYDRLARFIAERLNWTWDGAGLGIATRHAKLGPTSVNLGTARGDDAEASIVLNIRFTPPLNAADITSRLQDAAAAYGLEATADAVVMDPLFVDEQSELAMALGAAYSEVTGMPAACTYTGGTTYAKAFSNMMAFGPLMPGEPMLAHQVDERVSVDSIIRNAEIYAAALYRLTR